MQRSGKGQPPRPLAPRLPANYLTKGYFDQSGNLHEELIIDHAQQCARAFGARETLNKMGTSQLRRFFGHARAAEMKLNMTNDFPAAKLEIKKLIPFASEASSKRKVPECFLEFIEKNVHLVQDEKSFRKGFMQHFEAVVAFFYYLYPKQQ